jgi:Putative MetA-pathway of phenol degradation
LLKRCARARQFQRNRAIQPITVPRVTRVLLLISVSLSSRAAADHLGASGFGSGGGSSVFSADTLDAGHWAAALRLVYARPERRPDAELVALATQGVDAHNTDYNLVGALSIAYGINHHLTLSAELPYVRRDDLREGAAGGIERIGSVAGVGDMNLLAKYRLTDWPAFGFAVVGGLKLPTGTSNKRGPDGERLETEHQPGTGSWDPIVGASASAPLGSLTLTASGLYQWSTEGAQRTRLGDRLQGGIALSHRFGGAPAAHFPSHNHHHGDELDEHPEPHRSSWDAFVELASEWEGRQKIGGEVDADSGGKWAWAAPGLRFNASSEWSASASVAVPVWQRIRSSHPNNRYRLTLLIGRSF